MEIQNLRDQDFITYGEHDMADNIIHLVLASTGRPSGTKDLFLVLKHMSSEWEGDLEGI